VPNLTLASFGSNVRKFRNNKTLREASREIGIGPATLMRVEAGRVPDVDTFAKICRWLKVDPGAVLGFIPTKPVATLADTTTLVSAHLRADQVPNLETAQALARMIMVAVRRQKPIETNADV
jgi:transcriptional regulator with XRE-family HTH domain